MTKQKFNNSKAGVEQVASTKAQTIKLGLDVHADSIVVVRMVDHSAPQPAQKFRPSKFREWVKGQRRLADQVHSCYEAGPFGYGLHRELVALGVHNWVGAAGLSGRAAQRVNHDKSDAKELALRLDRWVAGNPHALATVRVPSPAEEQKRITSRQREQLKREVRRVAAQGRSLLLTQGYRAKGGWWGA
jgi:transposase